MLEPRIAQELKDLYQKLIDKGDLLSRERLDECYKLFRTRFGPERLAELDGELLLNTVHDRGGKDCLVYWLEYKDDEEFPAKFGGIWAGSALIYGIYKKKETGVWMTGSPQSQKEISQEQAIEFVRKQRDQLIGGVKLIEAVPPNGTDDDYRTLQEGLAKVAPDIYNTSWGHKYFSLICPDKLDDFHNPDYQRFHLIKLLQLPPETEGRYAAAGRFVRIAGELGMPINHLTALMNERNGRIHDYWRLDVGDDAWAKMSDGGFVAVGWPETGDLNHLGEGQEARTKLKKILEEKVYPGNPNLAGRKGQELLAFYGMTEGDIVLPSSGTKSLGIGRVAGEYYFEAGSDRPHRRPVQWLSLAEWIPPEMEGLSTTVFRVKKPLNHIAIERKALEYPVNSKTPVVKSGAVTKLQGIPGRIQSVLERKGQIILYGPPGTGKTYWAEKTALDLAAIAECGELFENLTAEQKTRLGMGGHGRVRFCCFHPSYGYEDFIEGYRPESHDGQMRFELKSGIFKKLCDDAEQDPEHRYYLIVDEINRGDIPRIFGELLTILEKNKRGKTLVLPLSGQGFRVPENLYIIGTMNTADRSIALLDAALRRRFGFVELMPDSSVVGDAVLLGVPLGLWLTALNQSICKYIGRDARNLQIGHSYLLEGGKPLKDFQRFARVLREEIIPLLEEYCYEDYATLEKILGPSLVNAEKQIIQERLFEPGMQEELARALLMLCPDLAASAAAVASTVEDEGVQEEAEAVEAQ